MDKTNQNTPREAQDDILVLGVASVETKGGMVRGEDFGEDFGGGISEE